MSYILLSLVGLSIISVYLENQIMFLLTYFKFFQRKVSRRNKGLFGIRSLRHQKAFLDLLFEVGLLVLISQIVLGTIILSNGSINFPLIVVIPSLLIVLLYLGVRFSISLKENSEKTTNTEFLEGKLAEIITYRRYCIGLGYIFILINGLN